MKTIRALLVLLLAAVVAVPQPADGLILFQEPTRRVNVLASAERSANGNTAAFGTQGYTRAMCQYSCSAFTGSSIALNIQTSADGGTTWTNHTGGAITFTATGQDTITVKDLGDTYRLKWTVTSATATFAFDCVFMTE